MPGLKSNGDVVMVPPHPKRRRPDAEYRRRRPRPPDQPAKFSRLSHSCPTTCCRVGTAHLYPADRWAMPTLSMKGFLQATKKSLLEGIASVFFFARLLYPCTGNGLASVSRRSSYSFVLVPHADNLPSAGRHMILSGAGGPITNKASRASAAFRLPNARCHRVAGLDRSPTRPVC